MLRDLVPFVQFKKREIHQWRSVTFSKMMRCAIRYHFHNLKNVKNTRGGVLILVKLQASQMVPNRATHHKDGLFIDA